jgi:hypothetical protein
MKLVVFLCLLAMCLFARAEVLLQSCEARLSDPNYALLTNYINHQYLTKTYGKNASDYQRNVMDGYCQIVGPQKFVFMPDPYRAQIFFCDFESVTKENPCQPAGKFDVYPNLELTERFHDSSAKEFVLLRTSSLRHGIQSAWFGVFYLDPHEIDKRGFSLFDLDVYEFNGSYSDEHQTCSHLAKSDQAVTLQGNKGYELINAGTANVMLRFVSKITNCKTGKEKRQIQEYEWTGQKFNKQIYKK